MRAGYRVQTVLNVVLVITVLFAVPAAVALGTATYTHAVARADQLSAGLRHIDAVVDTDSENAASQQPAASRAHWSLNGSNRTGRLRAPNGAEKGDPTQVWVDRNGYLASPPPDRSRALPDAIVLACVAFGIITLSVLLTRWSVARLLNRKRYRQWDRDWAAMSHPGRWHHP